MPTKPAQQDEKLTRTLAVTLSLNMFEALVATLAEYYDETDLDIGEGAVALYLSLSSMPALLIERGVIQGWPRRAMRGEEAEKASIVALAAAILADAHQKRCERCGEIADDPQRVDGLVVCGSCSGNG